MAGLTGTLKDGSDVLRERRTRVGLSRCGDGRRHAQHCGDHDSRPHRRRLPTSTRFTSHVAPSWSNVLCLSSSLMCYVHRPATILPVELCPELEQPSAHDLVGEQPEGRRRRGETPAHTGRGGSVEEVVHLCHPL